jgi:hypothetical protein
VTGGGHRLATLAAVVSCVLAGAPAARAAWDCGAPMQPGCPPSDAAGAGGALSVASPLQPLPAPVPGAPLFARGGGHVAAGLNEGSVDLGVAQPEQAAAIGAGLGATVARVALNWAFTQARPDSAPDWRSWDKRYRAYTAAGIRPIWAIQAAPRWAVDPRVAAADCPTRALRGPQARQECLVGPDAAHRGHYAAFAAQVARRYPLSAAIEIWNEPNLDYYWRAPDAAAYGALARTAIAAVRRVAPAMRILVGALAAPLYGTREAIRLDEFASVLARDGTIAVADGLSFHPYPLQLDAAPFREAFAQVDAALGVNGAPIRTRLVADEFGASTARRGSGQYQFSEDEQRRVLLGGFLAVDTRDPTLPRSGDVDAVVFHTDVDGAGGFGFVRSEPSATGGFAPRPVFCAIALLLRGTGLCGLPAAAAAAPAVSPPRARRAARACVAARRAPKAARAAPARSRGAPAAAGDARARRLPSRGRGRLRSCGRLRPGRYIPPRR